MEFPRRWHLIQVRQEKFEISTNSLPECISETIQDRLIIILKTNKKLRQTMLKTLHNHEVLFQLLQPIQTLKIYKHTHQ